LSGTQRSCQESLAALIACRRRFKRAGSIDVVLPDVKAIFAPAALAFVSVVMSAERLN
jgi:hypothetical protein